VDHADGVKFSRRKLKYPYHEVMKMKVEFVKRAFLLHIVLAVELLLLISYKENTYFYPHNDIFRPICLYVITKLE
jgi:hypothetical protein